MIPETNGIYRHFKGNLYKVLTVATHTETGEKMVVYQALYGSYDVFCRPLDMFLSKVDRDKYPDAKQEYRFEKVEEILDVTRMNTEETAENLPVREEKEEIPVPGEEDFDDDEGEFTGDPRVMEFLEAETAGERKEILKNLHDVITEDMIYTFALAMDVVIDEGSLEERYEQLMTCLNTIDKYEIRR